MTPAPLGQRVSAYVMAAFYGFAGVMHFITPAFFLAIVPPQLPWPLALVYLSGVAEVLLAVGLLVRRTRRLAAFGVVALLVAVYPANLYHWLADVAIDGERAPSIYHPIRAVIQLLLIAWAWWLARSAAGSEPKS